MYIQRMSWKHVVSMAVLPLGLALACGGNSDEGDDGPVALVPGSVEGKDASCSELCSDVASCTDLEVDECVEDCVGNDSVSATGQQVLATCFAEIGCDATLDEASLFSALFCLPDELEEFELSQTQATYCSDTVPVLQACQGDAATTSPLGSCEDTIGLASDDLVEDFNECAEEDGCEAVNNCLAFAALPLVGDLLLGGGDLESLDPGTISSLLALVAVLGPVGIEDDGGFGVDDFFGDDTSGPVSGAGGGAN